MPPRPVLSRASVLATALELVDLEGLESVSMRKVAQHMGVEAMSLYKYVENKAALLDGIYELVLREIPVQKDETGWKPTLWNAAVGLRTVLRQHHKVLPLFVTRMALSAGSIQQVEWVLGALRKSGFSTTQSLQIMQSLLAFVVGHCMLSFTPRDPASGPRFELSSIDKTQFPAVHEMSLLLHEYDTEREFLFGLDVFLTGLQSAAAIV